MTKAFLWILVLIALGFGGYTLIKEKGSNSAPAQEVVEHDATSGENGKKMSFAAFLNYDKGSYRCSVDQYLSDFDSEGVVYVDNGRLRGDFTTVAEGKTIDTSFLIKDGYQYVWSSMMKDGFKMKTQRDGAGSNASAASGTYSWNAEQIGEYDCQPWSSQEATFTLPSGKTFTDLSAAVSR